MTTVQKRLIAVIAAFALAFSCAFMLAAPQQAHAATTLTMSGKSLKGSAEYTTPKERNNTMLYAFTTSSRNSSYKITARPESSSKEVNVRLMDSSYGEVGAFTATKKKTVKFSDFDRNATYYIAVTAPEGYTQYSIAVKEAITAPAAVENLKVTSPKKYRAKVKWTKSFNTSGYQVRYKKGNGKWKYASKKVKKSKSSYTIKDLKRKKTYTIAVRPYRTVNGKNYYGKWASGTVVIK